MTLSFTKLAHLWAVKSDEPLTETTVTVAKSNGEEVEIDILPKPEWTNGKVWLYLPEAKISESAHAPKPRQKRK